MNPLHPSNIVRVHVERDIARGRDAMVLYVTVYQDTNVFAYLGEDGNWHERTRDQAYEAMPDAGLPMPHGFKQALLDELFPQNHSVEKELRAQLAQAEARVQQLIDKALS